MFVAFWLQLDAPFWAGTSAAIVCQPQLGASLRKGWFRMIGTVVGAVMIVVLTALFPQDRVGFFLFFALWTGLCAFVATTLRNFASYAASLAGYTAMIIAAGSLGATGGPSSGIFMLAVWRASEICIGIVCAGIVHSATDSGDAQHRLAESFADLAAGIAVRFSAMLALAKPDLPDIQGERREFLRRVIALDPMIDNALGESSRVHYHASTLQQAVLGLFRAIDGWRATAIHLSRLSDRICHDGAGIILSSLPIELRGVLQTAPAARWTADPSRLRDACDQAVHTLCTLSVDTPSLRLLADETAKVLAGLSQVADALALLSGAPFRVPAIATRFQLSAPDMLPALVNAVRSFLIIGAVELFWIVTAWPSGAAAIEFVAISLLLISPQGDQAFVGAVIFGLGGVAGVIGTAIIKFALLPLFHSFPAFCFALGVFLVPAGFAMLRIRNPAARVFLTAGITVFMPLLSPTNQMSYNTLSFYNVALAFLASVSLVPLAIRLLPPISPAVRARRLLTLALRGLRRFATGEHLPAPDVWYGRVYSQLAALPESAEPQERSQLLGALSASSDILLLRQMAAPLQIHEELDTAFSAIARGNTELARTRLACLDRQLASDGGHPIALLQRARARIVALSETLVQYSRFFDAGVPA
jgi:uncharacterized membrane protein YccC